MAKLGIDDAGADGRQAMMELAELSPGLAMEAAMALMSSPNQATREQGSALGAKVATEQGGRIGRSRAMLDFMAMMLSQGEAESIDFATKAQVAVSRRAGELLGRLPAARCMRIEKAIPGFASKARSESLWRAPELAGMLHAAGLISDQRAYGAATSAALARVNLRDQVASHGSSKEASHLQGLADYKLAGSFMDRAAAFDPEYAEAVFSTHWGINPSTIKGEELAQWGSMLAALPMQADALEGLSDPARLNAKQIKLLAQWFGNVSQCGESSSARSLGFYMGKSSEEWQRAMRERLAQSQIVLSIGWGTEVFRLAPSNASAIALACFQQLRQHEPSLSSVQKEPAARWLAFAEGLAKAGTAPPLFKMILSSRFKAIAADAGIGQEFQTGLACLAPLASAGVDLTGSKAYEWMISGATDAEAASISGLLGNAGRAMGTYGPEERVALAKISALGEAMELAVQVQASAAKPSRAPRI